jgi:hypothetical protein
MNAALLREKKAGRPVFPVLDLDLEARGFAIGSRRLGNETAIMLEGRQVEGLVPNAGFGSISYGPGMGGNTLVAARTSVKVNDPHGDFYNELETYAPRGSIARIRWASPFLTTADWELLFTGVLDDWKFSDGLLELLLKTDDAALTSPGPKPIFSRAETGYAEDPTIWGTSMPLVLGIHDSYKVTGRGMVPAVNIRWNEDTGEFWWCASIGALKSIPRIYLDGLVVEAGFSITRGVYGGVYQTIIQVDGSVLPTESDGKKSKGQVLSFDCQGPDANGGIAGDSITNPIAEMRAYLNNYTFRDNRTSVWESDADQIGTASWDVVQAYLDLYGYEGAFRTGGGERQEAKTPIEDFLKAKPWIKMWWSPRGQIDIAVIAHEDPSIPVGDWLNADTKVGKKDFLFQPGDRKEVFTGIISPYLYSHSESKYVGSYEAHDIAFVPRDKRVTIEIEDPFSQGRYDQD